jgi:hypothetical protein
MNVKKVIKELMREYPDKEIIMNDSQDPSEIYCILEPAAWNPEENIIVVVFDGKITHPHGYRKQTYEVLKGVLELTKEGKTYFLTEGQTLKESLDDYHLAVGKEAWVKVTSEPAWSPGKELPIEDPTS